MPEVLIVSDSPRVREEVISGLPDSGLTVRELNVGADVRTAVSERVPDLIVLDLQIGRMGGMAAAMDLHLEYGAGRGPKVPVLMLLDRRADVFLARRSNIQGWLIKPLDPMRVGRAITALLAGDAFEDPSYAPVTVPLR